MINGSKALGSFYYVFEDSEKQNAHEVYEEVPQWGGSGES